MYKKNKTNQCPDQHYANVKGFFSLLLPYVTVERLMQANNLQNVSIVYRCFKKNRCQNSQPIYM